MTSAVQVTSSHVMGSAPPHPQPSPALRVKPGNRPQIRQGRHVLSLAGDKLNAPSVRAVSSGMC